MSPPAGDATALKAQNDVTAAYNTIAGYPCAHDLTGQDLGGLKLKQGVFCFTSEAQLTGTLVLDAEGDPAAVFVFQIASKLTTASNASVGYINAGQECTPSGSRQLCNARNRHSICRNHRGAH